MTKMMLDRRRFLQHGATAAAVVLTAGTTMIVSTEGAWAMSLGTLDDATARSLLRMTRILYPHDSLGDVYYAVVVEGLDAEAKTKPDVATLLKEGAVKLDKAMGVPWLDLSEGYQTEVLQKMEADPFFQKVRGTTVVALYNNKLVWPQFGYQGSSWQDGGYLMRGFQDAGWTDTPPEDVSPPAYVG